MYYTLSSSVWWWSYGIMRRTFSKQIDSQVHEVYIDGLSGLAAGICTTVVTHPLDSITAKIMVGASTQTSTIGAIKEILHHEGFHVLWRGLIPSLSGTIVSSTVFALCYELIKRSSNIENSLSEEATNNKKK